jgi:hypothetical protein
MAKICYTPKVFTPAHLQVIQRANDICADYRARGFDLTLRQVYYQFVARGWLANKDTEYKRLGSIISEARLAGLLDWNYITDRTRNLRALGHWFSPSDIVRSAATSYHKDLWTDQPGRVEVWIEKDALVGVISGPCNELDVPHFSCRGYTSQSEMWSAARRIGRHQRDGQPTRIIHLGDHDPSGKDMTRDIADRLHLFLEGDGHDPEQLIVERIALNWPQIQQYNPPPNPAKITDSRATAYIAEFGDDSWELDALDPDVISDLVREAIYNGEEFDPDVYNEAVAKQEDERTRLTLIADNYDDVIEHLSA